MPPSTASAVAGPTSQAGDTPRYPLAVHPAEMVEISLLRLLFFPVMSAPYIFIMAGAQGGNAESGPYVATRYRLETTPTRHSLVASWECLMANRRTGTNSSNRRTPAG